MLDYPISGLNNLLLVQETVTTDEEYEVVPILESRNMHKRQLSIYKGKVLRPTKKRKRSWTGKVVSTDSFSLGKNAEK